MADFIKDVFSRMNLHQLWSFPLCGTDDFAEMTTPYRETLKAGSDATYKRLDKVYSDGVLNGYIAIPIGNWKKEFAMLAYCHNEIYVEYTHLRTEVQNAENILHSAE